MRVYPLLLTCWLASWVQLGWAASIDERDMKAALIYNFAMYTAWPDKPAKIFNVCTFEADQDSLNEALLESKMLNGMPVNVRTIRDVDDINACHVLFVEEAKMNNNQNLEAMLQKYSVLMVHNGKTHTDASMITIELVDKRYRFSINHHATKNANLTLSSKLLRLATRVY